METRWKLAILEGVAGLFGWVWIIASIASVYFFVAAIAFEGRWSAFLWVFGASIVAKWLAGGTRDHQKRVAYEAELVSRGLSPEEAREAWFKAYTQGRPSEVGADTVQTTASPGTSSEAALLAAQELINEYGAVLEHSKTVICSEAALPATKEKLKGALVALARHAKASGASAETLEPLRVGYASLANFVSERDAEAASTFDNIPNPTELDDAKLRELAAKFTAAGAGALDAMRDSTDEFARLTAEFDQRVQHR